MSTCKPSAARRLASSPAPGRTVAMCPLPSRVGRQLDPSVSTIQFRGISPSPSPARNNTGGARASNSDDGQQDSVSSPKSAHSPTTAIDEAKDDGQDQSHDNEEDDVDNGQEVAIHLYQQPSAVHDRASLTGYLGFLLDPGARKHNDINLTPLTEVQIRHLYETLCTTTITSGMRDATDETFQESDIPSIMNTVATFLPEGKKYAGALKKLQEMQLEWFDLRFADYTGFSGLSAGSYARRENLGLFACRADTIFVDRLWQGQDRDDADEPPPHYSEAEGPTILEIAQDLFERSSWDGIVQILEREEVEQQKLAAGWRYRIVRHPPRMSVQPGPMTTLVNILAIHTLDDLFNTRSIMFDYVVRRRQMQDENQTSLHDLAAQGLFYDLSGRLAADLAMIDHLPHVVDRGWKPILQRKILTNIGRYFKNFIIDPHTATLKSYTLREERLAPEDHDGREIGCQSTKGVVWRKVSKAAEQSLSDGDTESADSEEQSYDFSDVRGSSEKGKKGYKGLIPGDNGGPSDESEV